MTIAIIVIGVSAGFLLVIIAIWLFFEQEARADILMQRIDQLERKNYNHSLQHVDIQQQLKCLAAWTGHGEAFQRLPLHAVREAVKRVEAKLNDKEDE